jgi:hypothetical protein
MQLRAKEVRIVRGICRQIIWYGKKCYQDGLKEENTNPKSNKRRRERPV